MRILFGIGNPEKKQSLNRHNAGFMLLDYFAETHSLVFKPSKFDYYFAEGQLSDSAYVLIKPTTYVNKSGIAAEQAMKNYDVDVKDILVAYDDFNLEVASLRIRISGSDGGHNGLSSIIYQLNSDQFPRLRIGIGNNFKPGKMADYVLTNFNKEEKKNLVNAFKTGEILLEEFVAGGTKNMLDANSRLLKAAQENKKDISNQ